MTTTELSPASKLPQETSRHIRVDARFARLLAEDFVITTATVLETLEGKSQKHTIAICEWTTRAEEPAHASRCWARKHRKGRCRRARRAPGGPSRRHGEISGSPRDKRDGPGRGVDSPAPKDIAPECQDGCSLRSVLVDDGTLERIAKRLGVS